jgi:hypothetical protein
MTYLVECYRPGVNEPCERIVECLSVRSQLDPSSALVSKGDL